MIFFRNVYAYCVDLCVHVFMIPMQILLVCVLLWHFNI